MAYLGRPGVSPWVAALFAAGVIEPGMSVLDIGCGAGTDSVALARWGVRRVTGIDVSPRSIAEARRRARSASVQKSTQFIRCSIFDAPAVFDAGQFDVAVDTLLLNNLNPDDLSRYARGVAHAVRAGGLLTIEERIGERSFRKDARDMPPPRQLARFFKFGPTVATTIPEWLMTSGRGERRPGFARVAGTVGRRNRKKPQTPPSTTC
ncbi:MAG: class I SAM-dependent methyltransferase [Thermoplasmatota archaeon]